MIARLGLLAPLLLPLPALAATPPLAAGSYREAVRCAAINTIVLGAVRQDDETAMSAEDKEMARQTEAHAIGWLVAAVALNPKGEEATRADFTRDIETLTTALVDAGAASAVEAVLGQDLEHCLTREAAEDASPPDEGEPAGQTIS